MKHEKTIAIVGGGISGSLTALHLSRKGVAARIVVLDPAPQLGLGLAYSTPSMQHLLNVPAEKMTLLPDEPGHFLRWLRSTYDPEATGDQFVARAVFGRYMQSLLQTAPEIETVRELAIDCRLRRQGAVLSLSGGAELNADWVVLAVGNFLPAPLRGVSPAAENQGIYCHSAWEELTYRGIDPDSTILLIGSGLTAIDAWIRLRELGHRGIVRMVSRHGKLPQPSAPYTPLPGCVIEQPPQRARELLRAVRNAVESGLPWRAVVDSLRERSNEFWLALSPQEQHRFKRHLQRRWDVVRHRMAPAIAEKLAGELAAHKVEVVQGNVLAVELVNGAAEVTTKSRNGATQLWKAARVINCTGPDLNYSRVGSSLLSNMLERGDILSGPLGFGLWSNAHGALRNRNGEYSDVLFNVGPGRQGVLIESIAVPELRQQADDLAAILEVKVAQFSRDPQPGSGGSARSSGAP
ncbi:MAG: FAD/NAD(P)-binding protein [Terracidiphilus sp.]